MASGSEAGNDSADTFVTSDGRAFLQNLGAAHTNLREARQIVLSLSDSLTHPHASNTEAVESYVTIVPPLG